ncbi:dentin sialophosphoprotein-like [Mercenaria mercenaria]|uniref:dentin sialophosphoprotein-like n=1 Tax=Mercenaria mercenaria TaxID=6596 RepID=UPI00234F48AD|nr:dentin sialophosphoprotein-like [Mercenaria mercenaria]
MADLTPVKPEITKVSSLTSDSFGERWKICVKVKSKSGKSSLENGTDYFKVVLEDDSGQIEALAFGSQNVHRFFDRFEENKLYFISDGKLTVNENVPNEEQRCDEGQEEKEKRHPCQIHLESGTVVTCSGEENQPRSPFTPVTQLKQSTKTFVDVVGIVTGVWKLEMKYTQYRSINITDENGSDVNVALWGKLATEFDVRSISSVVSLKNVRVKKENGEVELQSTPNTEIEYKPSDPEAIVLREIHGIAEIVDELSDDMRDSEDDASHCRGCQKRRGSNSPACHRKRNDSGTSTGKGKCNKNNLTNGAICRRRGSGPGHGRRGRRNYSFDGNRTGRGRGRRRSVTNNDDFIDDEEESDIEDSEVDDLREYKKKRRPVRHCTRKSTMSVADDDNSDSDDDSDDTDDDVDDDDAIDNDKEDANEENGMKTRRRGRPCKRSLDKELDGASKTSSGRLTRLRQKSTTDSPKKASSSLQGPVTVISIETDEESDDDGIKPVSSAKKASKMYSSDDSDATVSYLETSNSSGKRKASDNDDGEDDDKSNDEKDVTKSSKKSSKKKFKRIKTTCTSSQETEKSVDQEEKDGDEHSSGSSGSDTDSSSSSSSSDTHSYHSGHGDMDGMWVEESPVESSYIQQLRAIQKDDDGTLNLLQHYILWFALKAGGEDCDDEFYKEQLMPRKNLEAEGGGDEYM